jgi:hypothetical protein
MAKLDNMAISTSLTVYVRIRYKLALFKGIVLKVAKRCEAAKAGITCTRQIRGSPLICTLHSPNLQLIYV